MLLSLILTQMMITMVRKMSSSLGYKVFSEQVQITPPVDPASDYVADVSGSHSGDGAENALFPGLQSLGEQVQITPSVDPASDYVAQVSHSESNIDPDDAEYALFPELQSLGEQVLQLIQLLP